MHHPGEERGIDRGASMSMRIVFMGSPDFAVPSLDRLVADGHTVALVVTQPDRPAGRGRDLRSPAVKRAAERHGLTLAQPERVSDPCVLTSLRTAQPELVVVVAFGQFLPQAVRELPPIGCINVHASLLPKFRGAAPIHRAVMAGETETGVTIMRVEGEMDAGPVLLQRACPILPEDDAGSLHDRLAVLGAAALADALGILAAGDGHWIPQDPSRVSLAPKLSDADCRVELAGDPVSLVNRIRGLSPAPGAYLILPDGERLRLRKAEARAASGLPGAIVAIEETSVVVGTGGGALALLEVQPAGKRRMTAAEFARGRRLRVGMRYA
jgi:methionyl-tRNA formyltransferase